MRQKRAKKVKDQVFVFTPADGRKVVIGDAGKHRELTPAKLKEAKADQEDWSQHAESPFVRESPQLAAVIRARRQIPEWRQSVELIQAELKKRSITPEDREFLKERLAHFQTVLAEMLAKAGLYAEAAKTHLAPEMRAKYKRIIEAIEKPDDQDCGCEHTDPTLKTAEGIVNWVWSKKHGCLMPLIACHHCGDWNVKPETAEISKMRGLRRQAEQLTANARSIEDARNALKRANHPTL